MQLENIATPQEQATPQLRYAQLHRAVERGMASQEVLCELAEICLQLGHRDEAVRVHAAMAHGPSKEHVASRLQRHGLDAGPRGARPTAAVAVDDDPPSLSEHLLDSVQFLSHGYMPVTALTTMLAFPLVVAGAGVFTAGMSPWIFPAIAAATSLLALLIVAAVVRAVFLHSTSGEEELPRFPAAAEILPMARRTIADTALALGLFIAPGAAMLALGAPITSSLVTLVLGMALAPIAWSLRQCRGDWRAFSPVLVVRAASASPGILRLSTVVWAAALPAAGAAWAAFGKAPWLQLAVVGPLAVLPAFMSARMLGTFLSAHRERLQPLLQGTVQRVQGAARAPRRATPVGAPRAEPRAKQSTMAGRRGGAPSQRPAQPPAPAQGQRPAQRPTQAPAAHIEGRRPQTQPTARPAPRAAMSEAPDLSNIPGATVVRGADRARYGAASRRD